MSASCLDEILGKAIEIMGMGMAFAVFAGVVAPIVIAENRKHPAMFKITLVNALLGWTVIGWVVALWWACSPIDEKDR